MTEYDNTNRGTLNKVRNKNSDKSPDYYGDINIDGVDKKISAWVRTNKNNGRKFLSLSVKDPDDQYDAPQQQAAPAQPVPQPIPQPVAPVQAAPAQGLPDDDIPF